MSLIINFNEDAFTKHKDADSGFDKTEYKKFNMRFNNFDLAIIDAIAKRDGISRSTIINAFIEATLRRFLCECDENEAMLLIEHAEYLSAKSTSSNSDFSWDIWYSLRGSDPRGQFHNSLCMLKDELESDETPSYLKELKLLLEKDRIEYSK